MGVGSVKVSYFSFFFAHIAYPNGKNPCLFLWSLNKVCSCYIWGRRINFFVFGLLGEIKRLLDQLADQLKEYQNLQDLKVQVNK